MNTWQFPYASYQEVIQELKQLLESNDQITMQGPCVSGTPRFSLDLFPHRAANPNTDAFQSHWTPAVTHVKPSALTEAQIPLLMFSGSLQEQKYSAIWLK